MTMEMTGPGPNYGIPIPEDTSKPQKFHVMYTYEVQLPSLDNRERIDELTEAMLRDRADGTRPTNYTRALCCWLVEKYQVSNFPQDEFVVETGISVHKIDHDVVKAGHV